MKVKSVRFPPIADTRLRFWYSVGVNARRAAFDKLIAPIGLSSICLFVLVGSWAYSGSLLPSTKGASASAAMAIWLFWAVLISIPAVTLCLWMLAVHRNNTPKR
jgi:hypothetical protein